MMRGVSHDLNNILGIGAHRSGTVRWASDQSFPMVRDSSIILTGPSTMSASNERSA